ncbi:pyridoxamine 5'-phosphate oxidase family protein [Streptomyces griseoviridis]|uniref:Uncharacterized protein n=1 Tax=Streptomyces griseoviridis TaxID=45398 RepID=A0A918GH95_STRGD|nr:pyridoxamine 5'-phosphate oxidase family protein [Streptomyces niveoruber]GGS37137.1 hypothetical protein GCM10010238_28160 [Streptomyces niveoruber]
MPLDASRAVGLLGRTAYGRAATTLRALPLLASARHIVSDGRVLPRVPRNGGYHRVRAGGAGRPSRLRLRQRRSRRTGRGPVGRVRVVGRREPYEPAPAEPGRSGPAPGRADGAPFGPSA